MQSPHQLTVRMDIFSPLHIDSDPCGRHDTEGATESKMTAAWTSEWSDGKGSLSRCLRQRGELGSESGRWEKFPAARVLFYKLPSSFYVYFCKRQHETADH